MPNARPALLSDCLLTVHVPGRYGWPDWSVYFSVCYSENNVRKTPNKLTRGAVSKQVRDVMFPPESVVTLQSPGDVTMCDVTATTADHPVTVWSALEPRVARYRRIRTIDYWSHSEQNPIHSEYRI